MARLAFPVGVDLMPRILILRRDDRLQHYRVSAERALDYDSFPVTNPRTGRTVTAYIFNPEPTPGDLAEGVPAGGLVEVRIVVAGDYRSTRPGRDWRQERELRAVLREADLPAFKAGIVDYLRGTGFPLPIAEGDPLDGDAAQENLVIGEVGPRRFVHGVEPGVYDVRVRMKGKTQFTASETMLATLSALPLFGPFQGDTVSEAVQSVRRAVREASGRWRDPETGRFSHGPGALE